MCEQDAQPGPDATPKRVGRSVAHNTGIVSALTMLSRVLGLIRESVIAAYFGAGATTDAFYVAFRIPNLLRRLVAEGSLATAFVPVFAGELSKSKEEGRKALNATIAFSLLITLILSTLGVVFAEEIIGVIAPGFADDPEQASLAVSLTEIMFPFVAIISLVALTGSALNVLHRFALPALAPALLNVAIIISVVVFWPYIDRPVFGLAWAVLAGGVFGLVAQLIALYRIGYGPKIVSPRGSAAVRRLVKLMLPSILSSSAYQFMIFINTVLASMLASGSVSWLNWADRLFQFPLGVFSIALGTALLPELSRSAARKDEKSLRRQLMLALNWVTYVCVPASVGLIVFSRQIISAIYQYGAFAEVDVNNTALALIAFGVGLWSISAQVILVRAFLAKENSRIPAVVMSLSIFVNIVLAFVLMGAPVQAMQSDWARFLGLLQLRLATFELGHAGLALAGSLASFVTMFLLILLLPRVGTEIDLRSFLSGFIRAASASFAMALVLLAVDMLGLSPIPTLLIGIPLGAGTFFLSTLAAGSPEAKNLIPFLGKLFGKRAD